MMLALAITTILAATAARARERSQRLKALAQDRHAAALALYVEAARLYPGEIDIVDLYANARVLMEAERDLEGPAAAATAHLGRMKNFERQLRLEMSKPSRRNYGDMPMKLRLYIKEAEYWAAKEEW
jgi:hypothetical protein